MAHTRRAANALARTRASRQWTQTDLAQAVGVSRATLQRSETSAEPPSLKLLVAVAATLDVALEELLDDQWLRYETRTKGGRPTVIQVRMRAAQ